MWHNFCMDIKDISKKIKKDIMNIVSGYRSGGDSREAKRITLFFGAGINKTFFEGADL